jgi:hypothetical protein
MKISKTGKYCFFLLLLSLLLICFIQGNDSDSGNRKIMRLTWKHVIDKSDVGPTRVATTAYYLNGKSLGSGKDGIKKLMQALKELHGDEADLIINGYPIEEKNEEIIVSLPELLTIEAKTLIEFCRGYNIRLIIDPHRDG